MSKIIENVDDVKLLIGKYEWFKDKALDLLDDYYDYDGNIDEEMVSIECCDDDLEISFTTNDYCCGEHLTGYYTAVIPIAWLFLDDEELKKAKEEKKEAEEEVRRKQEELNEMFRKKEQEQKEREEYERLKEKFEGGLKL